MSSATDLKHEVIIDQATRVTFSRLHALLKRGFEPELGSDVEAIWLRHPRESFKHKQVILYPTGKLVVLAPDKPNSDIHIFRDETKEFQHFIQSAPLPNMWDKSWRIRERTVGLLFFAVLWLVAWRLTEALGINNWFR